MGLDKYSGVIFGAFWLGAAVIWIFAIYGFIKMFQ